MTAPGLTTAQVLTQTRHWLERAVIGLNLCPFAKSVYTKEQVHYVVYPGLDGAQLLDILRHEMQALTVCDPHVRETTLVIAPLLCPDFWDFNGLTARAQRVLRKSGLEGVLQIASFHPAYEFADDAPQDMAHYTNRAPYPIFLGKTRSPAQWPILRRHKRFSNATGRPCERWALRAGMRWNVVRRHEQAHSAHARYRFAGGAAAGPIG